MRSARLTRLVVVSLADRRRGTSGTSANCSRFREKVGALQSEQKGINSLHYRLVGTVGSSCRCVGWSRCRCVGWLTTHVVHRNSITHDVKRGRKEKKSRNKGRASRLMVCTKQPNGLPSREPWQLATCIITALPVLVGRSRRELLTTGHLREEGIVSGSHKEWLLLAGLSMAPDARRPPALAALQTGDRCKADPCCTLPGGGISRLLALAGWQPSRTMKMLRQSPTGRPR